MNTFEKVYAVVSKIPKGKVLTYKKVAQLAGINPPAGGPRVVGFALNKNKNPKIVPCHRVVSATGKLTGYAFGGIKKKKEILQKEGIRFLANDIVDLKNYLFKI